MSWNQSKIRIFNDLEGDSVHVTCLVMKNQIRFIGEYFLL